MSWAKWLLELSIPIYRILMRAYPEAFRRQYGESMIQIFRDLGRDAAGGSGIAGLIKFWSKILPDLVCSVVEQNFNHGSRIMGKLAAASGAVDILVLLAIVAYASVTFRDFYMPPDFNARLGLAELAA
ncbi:MAG: hypothetical protein ACRD1R_15020 [Acidobacteriota bacterium]